MTPIGIVHTTWRWRPQAPRQGTEADARAEIVLNPGMQNTLQDLNGFSHIWVIWLAHRSRGWNHQVVPPRDRVKRGLFATRAPDRPNPIGLTCARLVRIVGCSLWIDGHDLLDGTPVLDLKPYIRDYDCFPTATRGWLDTLSEPGPDHYQQRLVQQEDG